MNCGIFIEAVAICSIAYPVAVAGVPDQLQLF
jgi:hypothetical protein